MKFSKQIFVLLAIVLLIVGPVVLVSCHANKQSDKIDVLTQKNSANKTVIAALDTSAKQSNLALENKEKAAEVDIKSLDAVVTEHKVIDTKVNKNKKKTQVKIDEIEKEYSDKEKTPQTEKEKETAVSSVQINSLWEVYCENGGSAESCSSFNQVKVVS